MKIKFKLSIVVIAIMAVVVTGIATLLLWQASKNTLQLSLISQERLANSRAEFWKGRLDGYIRMLTTLANVMGDFEDVKAEERRDKYDEMLRAAMDEESQMVFLYTIWKPNALDGMDARYIDRTGSSPTGQYAMAWSKETGDTIKRTSTDIDNVMKQITGPKAKKDRVDEPEMRMINGVNKYTMRIAVPIINNKNAQVVGSLGCILTLDIMQKVLENVFKANKEVDVLVIYSNEGMSIAHFIPERIGRHMLDVDAELGDFRNEILDAMKNGDPYTCRVYDPALGMTVRVVVKPIQIGNSDFNLSILIGVTEAKVLKEIRAITRFTVILAVLAILATAAIVFVVLGYITKPIVTVTDTLKDISEGEGDLTRTIPEKGNDEIADMSRYFNLTLEKIKKLIISIKEQTGVLSDTGNELSSNMSETAAAVNQITSNIQNIKGRVLHQNASVNQTGATMGQITSNIDKLNGYVERQTANVTQSSSAIEEMLSNIQSVTQALVKNGKSVQELSSASELGRISLEDAASDIQEIARDSEGLLEINRVMNDIADQTNLLSMNAAIEAAHAGETGKGFAVVADEIRKLAESSSEQSQTISLVLKKIKDSIDKISESTGNSLARFEVIDTGVKTVSDQAVVIRNAMEEQNSGGKNILEAVGKLNEITRQVKDESKEMLNGSKEVIQESRKLEHMTQEITGGINEMVTGAQEINKAINRVNDISARNRENINILVREVSMFKVT